MAITAIKPVQTGMTLESALQGDVALWRNPKTHAFFLPLPASPHMR